MLRRHPYEAAHSLFDLLEWGFFDEQKMKVGLNFLILQMCENE